MENYPNVNTTCTSSVAFQSISGLWEYIDNWLTEEGMSTDLEQLKKYLPYIFQEYLEEETTFFQIRQVIGEYVGIEYAKGIVDILMYDIYKYNQTGCFGGFFWGLNWKPKSVTLKVNHF